MEISGLAAILDKPEVDLIPRASISYIKYIALNFIYAIFHACTIKGSFLMEFAIIGWTIKHPRLDFPGPQPLFGQQPLGPNYAN